MKYEWVMLASLSLLSFTYQSPALPIATHAHVSSSTASKYIITRSDVHEVLSKLVLDKTGFYKSLIAPNKSREIWIFVSICNLKKHQQNHQAGWKDRVAIRFRWHIEWHKCQFEFNNHTARSENSPRTSANQIEFFRWVYFWSRNVQFKA